MTAKTLTADIEDGVEVIQEANGRITDRDVESGVASYGETKAQALAMLAEVLALHTGGGDPVTDEDLSEFGLDPDDADTASVPRSCGELGMVQTSFDGQTIATVLCWHGFRLVGR